MRNLPEWIVKTAINGALHAKLGDYPKTKQQLRNKQVDKQMQYPGPEHYDAGMTTTRNEEYSLRHDRTRGAEKR